MKKVKLADKEFSIFITEEEINQRIGELAMEIKKDYQDKLPLLLIVLNGAFRFASRLIDHNEMPCELSFIKIASYQNTESKGKVESLIGLTENLEDREVIIVEDVIDTGLSMDYLLHEINERRPKEVKIASLLFKPGKLQKNISPDYVGFQIPDNFVVGFGLDYNGLGRELNAIYTLISTNQD